MSKRNLLLLVLLIGVLLAVVPAFAAADPDVHARAMREIILPTIRGMEKDGIPFTGFLYACLLYTSRCV